MADQEKRIHQLSEVGDKTDLYIALDSAALPEAVKFNANNIIDKAYTDTLYVKLSGNETVNGVKTWVNQQILQNGADVTGGNISIQSGGKLSVNQAIGTYICEMYLPKNCLKLGFADTTDGYTQILFADETHSKWSCGVLADTYTTTAEQNMFYIFQQTDKAGGSVAAYRFVIDNAGNVGIGTSAPTLKFNVVGNSYFNGNVGIGTSTMTTVFNVTGNSYFNGNVGIGVSPSSYKFHIYGGNIKIQSSSSGVSAVAFIQFEDGSPANLGWIGFGSGSNNDFSIYNQYSGANIGIYTNSGTGITIDSTGKIGLGLTSPSYKLDIDGAAYGVGQIRWRGTSGGTGLYGYTYSDAGGCGITGSDPYSELIYLNTGSKYIAFYTNGNFRMTIDNSGNVGIGYTSPQCKLHVENGAIYANATTSDTIFNGTITNIATLIGYNGYWAIRTGANQRICFDVYNSATPIEAFTIFQNGDIQINYATATGYKFYLRGTSGARTAQIANTATTITDDQVVISSSTISSGTSYYIFKAIMGSYTLGLRADGLAFSTAISNNSEALPANVGITGAGELYIISSSEKLKENIKYKIDPNLIFQLKPAQFTNKRFKIDLLGFIAEQVKEIDKRFTDQRESDTFGIDTTAILAATVAGLQNINDRLKKLEKQPKKKTA